MHRNRRVLLDTNEMLLGTADEVQSRSGEAGVLACMPFTIELFLKVTHLRLKPHTIEEIVLAVCRNGRSTVRATAPCPP